MAWRDVMFSDEVMGTFAPLVVYWIYGGIYHLLPGSLNRFRMHSKKEEEQKNAVSLKTVVKGVLLQQSVQAIVALAMFSLTAGSGSGKLPQPPVWIQLRQFLVAMFVMDAWQYFMHRYMHHNKFLYKHIHSQHHRLVVPYAFGALFNHPVEGLLQDTIGGVLSFLISGMTPHTSVFFFCFATMKTVDDHCGLWLPGNPFQLLFQNNAAYHDVHHQLHGTKHNFSQPFFILWDKLLGTHMPFSLDRRPDGGLEARTVKARPDDGLEGRTLKAR